MNRRNPSLRALIQVGLCESALQGTPEVSVCDREGIGDHVGQLGKGVLCTRERGVGEREPPMY